jgi:hypothetical protein
VRPPSLLDVAKPQHVHFLTLKHTTQKSHVEKHEHGIGDSPATQLHNPLSQEFIEVNAMGFRERDLPDFDATSRDRRSAKTCDRLARHGSRP